LRPEQRNHVWSYDFVEERTHDGHLQVPRDDKAFDKTCGAMSCSEKFAGHSEPGAPNFGYPPQNVEAVASE
jgi:hypothetical protein